MYNLHSVKSVPGTHKRTVSVCVRSVNLTILRVSDYVWKCGTHTKNPIRGVAYSESYVRRHRLAFRQEEANYPLPSITTNVPNLIGYSQNVFVFCVGGSDPESARRSFFFWVSDLKSCLMKDSLITLTEIGLLLSTTQASIRLLAFCGSLSIELLNVSVKVECLWFSVSISLLW